MNRPSTRPTTGSSANPFSRSVVLGQREAIDPLQEEIAAELARRDYPEQGRFAVRLALEEAAVNAFRHGNRNEPGKTVSVRATIDDREAVFEVEDQGEGFDPGCVPDPTLEENIEIPSGRGIMLIRAYMSEVAYLPPGNIIRMVYRNPSAK
ncbi:MAG: ATP-binding protein [Phycisphaeraceae bacterium]|nr:ATP-binding protein [Phycisphaeraceae bacterium]